MILLQLFDSSHEKVSTKSEKIENQKCNMLLSNWKEGKYEIRYFHDGNSNNKFDTNLIGLPTEGYGFSNDAFGIFGPKPFKEWLLK